MVYGLSVYLCLVLFVPSIFPFSFDKLAKLVLMPCPWTNFLDQILCSKLVWSILSVKRFVSSWSTLILLNNWLIIFNALLAIYQPYLAAAFACRQSEWIVGHFFFPRTITCVFSHWLVSSKGSWGLKHW